MNLVRPQFGWLKHRWLYGVFSWRADVRHAVLRGALSISLCVSGLLAFATSGATIHAQSTPPTSAPTSTPTATPSEESATEESATEESRRVHVVSAGESLSLIAQRYGVSQAALMAENGITNPDAIRIGQQLVLPSDVPEADVLQTDSARPAVGVDVQYTPDDEPAEHVVLPGETLLGIALRYGLVPNELMELNGITNPNHIVIGRRLRLSPAPATEPARLPEAEDALDPTGATRDADATPEDEVLDVPELEDTEPEDTELEDIEPEDLLWTISTLNRRIHTRPGDTLARVALRYGVNEDALRNLNGLDAEMGVLPLETELVLPATRQELEPYTRAAGTPTGDGTEEDTNVYHEIQPGESLGLIAQAYGLTLADLLSANRITDPNNILIGARLLIPDPTEENAEDARELPPHLGRPARGYFFYTVQPGDTLSQLAREFNTTFLAILDYNNLPDPETVFRGVDLRIPFGPPEMPMVQPPSPQSGTSFMISLSRQQCWVFRGDRVLHEWVCSTGYGEWITRTGVFAVQTKLEMAQSSYYELDMPYWLGIYDVGAAENGIHGLPIDWETGEKIWEGLLGQPATFGCAMLADEDAVLLFDLAYLGMPVYIVN